MVTSRRAAGGVDAGARGVKRQDAERALAIGDVGLGPHDLDVHGLPGGLGDEQGADDPWIADVVGDDARVDACDVRDVADDLDPF